MFENISVVIIAKDSSDTIAATLESAKTFPEIIVYDNGSKDSTPALAKSFENVTFHQGEFFGFGKTKNHAISLAQHDWVLCLDSDEIISSALLEFLSTWKPETTNAVGLIRRDNFFMGKLIENGGFGQDWLIRLFNRNEHLYDDAPVHESVTLKPSSKIQRIAFPIEHHAVSDISEIIQKIDHYSEIRRQTSKKTYHPFIIILKSLFAFIKSYIFKGGIFSGWRGLVIAWSISDHVFYKYMKIYADKDS